MTLLDTPHGWNRGIPGSATAAPYPKIRCLIAVSLSVNFRIPYGISILYNILEMNVMFFFANPTRALCIPTPEGWGFTAYSITKMWLVNG